MPDNDTVTTEMEATETTQTDNPEGDGEQFDKERAMATIRKLREGEKAAKAAARELETLKAQVKKDPDAKPSEQEKLQKRVSELERQNAEIASDRQSRVVRYEVMLAASQLNIVDPEAAFKLLDTAALEYDDNGNPSNVQAALRALVKAKPYLVKSEQPKASINAGDGQGKAQPDTKAREAELRQRFRI